MIIGDFIFMQVNRAKSKIAKYTNPIYLLELLHTKVMQFFLVSLWTIAVDWDTLVQGLVGQSQICKSEVTSRNLWDSLEQMTGINIAPKSSTKMAKSKRHIHWYKAIEAHSLQQGLIKTLPGVKPASQFASGEIALFRGIHLNQCWLSNFGKFYAKCRSQRRH